MSWRQLYPDEWVDSAYGIPYEKLYEQGIRGVIFDIDNTLVPHGAPADEKALALFERFRGMGMKTCLMSNNRESRVEPFAGQVGSGYIHRAGKPGVQGYLRAMEQMGTGKDSTVFVGDQIFTDIYGANRAGIRTFLTKPIDPKEEIQIVLKRYLEAVVLYFYKRDRRKSRPDGDARTEADGGFAGK